MRRSTSPPTPRSMGCDVRRRRDDRRARRGVSSGRGRRIAPPSSSSTSTRTRGPRAARGGRSACPRCPIGRRSGRRGPRSTRPRPTSARRVIAVRVAVLGCGRIGRLHAELLARRIPGAALAKVFDVVPSAAVGPRCRVRRPGGGVGRRGPLRRRRRGGDLHQHRHPRRADRPRRRGRAADVLREAGVARPRRGRRRARRRRRLGHAPARRLQPALRPGPPRRAGRRRRAASSASCTS